MGNRIAGHEPGDVENAHAFQRAGGVGPVVEVHGSGISMPGTRRMVRHRPAPGKARRPLRFRRGADVGRHEMSCDVMVRGEIRIPRPVRSIGAVRVEGVVAAAQPFACRRRQSGGGRPPALCHDMSCSPCRCRRSALPFLHIVLSVAFRSAPIRPRRRRLGRRRAAGPLLRARGGRRTSPVHSRRGFFGSCHCFARAEKQKGGPGSRLLSTCILLQFPSSQSFCEQKVKLLLCLAGSRSPAPGAMDGPRAPPLVTPDPDPGPSLGSLGSLGRLALPSATSGCGAGRSWAPAFAGVTKRGGKRPADAFSLKPILIQILHNQAELLK